MAVRGSLRDVGVTSWSRFQTSDMLIGNDEGASMSLETYPDVLSGDFNGQQLQTPIFDGPQPRGENCRIVYDVATIEVTRNGVSESGPYPVKICD